jgi:hypothetical protein
VSLLLSQSDPIHFIPYSSQPSSGLSERTTFVSPVLPVNETTATFRHLSPQLEELIKKFVGDGSLAMAASLLL